MKDRYSACAEIVAYFLWEYTKHSNALNLWYCAEEIGFFLAECKICSREQIKEIVSLPKNDEGYIEFVRQFAFRIYLFSGNDDSLNNWFVAERLLQNDEWIDAAATVSKIYSEIRKGNIEMAGSVRTERFRKLFF